MTPPEEQAIGMLVQPHFRDRSEAGNRLAKRLDDSLGGLPSREILVLALPPGGVPVAAPIAARLSASLDVFLVRPLPLPTASEVAIGAVASSGVRMLNETVIRARGVSEEVVARIAKEEQRALTRREAGMRGERPPTMIGRKTVILVADGAATGATLEAAAAAIRTHEPERIIAAIPIAAPEALRALEGAVDEVVCEWTPDPFLGVGASYDDFEEPSDAEVRRILDGGRR